MSTSMFMKVTLAGGAFSVETTSDGYPSFVLRMLTRLLSTVTSTTSITDVPAALNDAWLQGHRPATQTMIKARGTGLSIQESDFPAHYAYADWVYDVNLVSGILRVWTSEFACHKQPVGGQMVLVSPYAELEVIRDECITDVQVEINKALECLFTQKLRIDWETLPVNGVLPKRIFSGHYPCGIVYADREVEVGGDYARLAFLSYSTLELEFDNRCSPHFRALIERHAAALQARKGESYPVTTSGQTVLLGAAVLSQ